MTTRKTDSRNRNDETPKTSRSHERYNGRDGIILTGTGISFTAPRTFADSGNGLAVFTVGDRVRIEGTASNNGQFVVSTVAAGTGTFEETVVTEAAGNSVKIQRIER